MKEEMKMKALTKLMIAGVLMLGALSVRAEVREDLPIPGKQEKSIDVIGDDEIKEIFAQEREMHLNQQARWVYKYVYVYGPYGYHYQWQYVWVPDYLG